MSVIIDGTAGITFPNSTTQLVAGAPLTTPSFTTTIGVGAATASASGAGITFSTYIFNSVIQIGNIKEIYIPSGENSRVNFLVIIKESK